MPHSLSLSEKTAHGAKQRVISIPKSSNEIKPKIPWISDKTTPVSSIRHSGSMRLHLPKRRVSAFSESGSGPCTPLESVAPMEAREDSTTLSTSTLSASSTTTTAPDSYELENIDMTRDSLTSNLTMIDEDNYSFEYINPTPQNRSRHYSVNHGQSRSNSTLSDTRGTRSTRSMSAIRNNIALSTSSRESLTRRLSHNGFQFGTATSAPTILPIATRSRMSSSVSSPRIYTEQRASIDTHDSASTELTIRLSIDASRSLGYQMLLEGDSLLSELSVLEDEYQRTVMPTHPKFHNKLIGIYIAATWSADCDDFTPQLKSVSAAHGDDLVIVHISADNHPADMERIMTGSGWLCVPWSERKIRHNLMSRLGMTPNSLPVLIVIDGSTHHIVTRTGRSDVEHRPLTCVREWRSSHKRSSWWSSSKPW